MGESGRTRREGRREGEWGLLPGGERRRGSRRRGARRRDDAAPHPALLVTAGFFGGLAVGVAAWGGVLQGNRRGLFSRRPMRRFAAVRYLVAHPSVDTARLLRDYVRWESQPLLRRLARQALAAVEASLER